MHLINIDLTSVTSPQMLITVCLHGGPIVSCPLFSPLVPTRMGSEGTFMQISHNLFRLTLVYTPMQGRIMIALVEDFVTEEELGRESS